MSYAVKYSSNLYAPFRNAVSAATQLGHDKKNTYQMDYGNINEALREASLDIKEGADILLIKPGIMYLDVLKEVKSTFNYPTFSYQVSGEYSMLKNAILSGEYNEKEVIIKRKVTHVIVFTYISYHIISYHIKKYHKMLIVAGAPCWSARWRPHRRRKARTSAGRCTSLG